MRTSVALAKDCWFCGGYLPRRLRVGGIHILCSHAYDDWTEYPMTDTPLTDTPLTAKELRATFRDVIFRHGGRRAGDQYAVPCGEPIDGRQPFLRLDVVATGYGRHNCTITLDRWNASNPPGSARAWLEEHMHPYTRRATEKVRGTYWLTLPGNSDYTQATIRRADVAEVLDKWIPQEKFWQTQKGPE